MQSLRYYFRLAMAFVGRFKAILLVGVGLGFLIFFAISFIAPSIFRGTSQRIGINGRYHTDTLPSFILDTIGDGLTKLNESGTPEPDLATSWESPDKGKTWIFHLGDRVTWQDGKPVTSQTIVYQFSDVVTELPDEKTIIFKLQNPFAPFPAAVARPTFRKGLLGTGEFKVKKLSLAGPFVQELTLVNSKKDKKIFKFYPTLERTELAFKLGEVDKIINIFDPEPFQNWNTANIQKEVNTDQIVTLFFNTQDSLLSEKSLRQALVYSIDKDSFNGQRAISPISPNSWAYNPQAKEYNYDLKRAEELMDELPQEAKSGLQIKLVSTPALLPTAEKIANQWDKLGIETTVLVSSIIPNEFQVFLTIFDIPKDPDQYAFWHSTQTATNISNYSSPRIDKFLEDGRVQLDYNERRRTYLDFQRFLTEDLPAVFLFYPSYYTIARK